MPYNDKISSVAVIGAGTMGAAIAQHFLMKNLDVILLDLKQESLDKGVANINASLDEAVKRRILREEKKADTLARLTSTTNYADLKNAQYVVEAVFEDEKIKQSVFVEVEKNVSAECIIASNTSSFSIAELGSVLQNKKRFLGVHYFYHAAKNKLVELIAGKDTDTKYLDKLMNFYYDKDKAPIVVADAYGFAVNRFFVPWLNEAVRLHEEGIGSMQFIDEVAMKVFSVGMGPFALMNATGVPITLHSTITLATHFGEMHQPPKLLIKQVEELKQDWDIKEDNSFINNEEIIKNRLLGMTLGIAAQMVSENVTSVTETDLGARLGLRWPMGPFELANHIGIKEIKTIVATAFEPYGTPMPKVLKEVDENQGFFIEHIKAHCIGSTGLLEFNRPDAMNAINPSVMQCLSDAFDKLEQNDAIEKIILFGRGKAFIAGADIKFFVDHIQNNTINEIYSFTQAGHRVLDKIANSKKQTIAFLDGLTLGGGLELALAFDARLATKRTVLSFPETSIGIYPGLGGTQRTPRLIKKGLAKFLIATGNMIKAEQALEFGLVNQIIDSTNDLNEIASICVGTSIVKESEATTILVQTFASFDGVVNDALFENADFEPYQKSLRAKAPLALQKAIQLIDAGSALSLQEGLELELKSLEDIFATKDALAGLGGILTRTPAKYIGQ